MKDVRPTSGLVLSALFNILGEFEDGAKFLDLFAGTGRVGFEALKRGAKEVVFVENIRSRAESIKKSGGLVLNLDIRRAITWLVKREMKFNFIFADPPYNSGWCETITGLKDFDKLFFDSNSIFVIEHSSREILKFNSDTFNIFSQRQYGETQLSFLRRIF